MHRIRDLIEKREAETRSKLVSRKSWKKDRRKIEERWRVTKRREREKERERQRGEIEERERAGGRKRRRGPKSTGGPTAVFREPGNYTARLPRRRGVKIVLSSLFPSRASTVSLPLEFCCSRAILTDPPPAIIEIDILSMTRAT